MGVDLTSRIEPARRDDRDTILDLIVRQFDEHAINAPHEALRQAIDAVLSDADLGFILLARRDGVAIGVAYVAFICSLEHCGRSAWLEELYVLPAERGRGIGEMLLQAALAGTRERGCAAVDLEVERSQQRAENLYRRAGFEPMTRARWVRRHGE
jgi:GNAT superfamily N-acetyltransferase